jgi:hypothetical protein
MPNIMMSLITISCLVNYVLSAFVIGLIIEELARRGRKFKNAIACFGIAALPIFACTFLDFYVYMVSPSFGILIVSMALNLIGMSLYSALLIAYHKRICPFIVIAGLLSILLVVTLKILLFFSGTLIYNMLGCIAEMMAVSLFFFGVICFLINTKGGGHALHNRLRRKV